MDATPICAARIGSSQTNSGLVDDFSASAVLKLFYLLNNILFEDVDSKILDVY